MSATTEEVLGHHLQAIFSQNLEDIASDYTDDAVVFAPNGVFQGKENIRAFFAAALGMLGSAVSEISLIKQEINGEYAYILWSAGSVLPFAGDSFHIRDGKILMQSAAFQM